MRFFHYVMVGALAALTTLVGFASSAHAEHAPWAGDTANTVAPGRWEFGLLSPSRVALNERVELSTNLLLNVALPNVGAKVGWGEVGAWRLATSHRLTYPTRLINTLAGQGAGGILPISAAETDPGLIFGLETSALATRTLRSTLMLTGHLGAAFAPRLTDHTAPLIDFPFLYQRTAQYNSWGTVRGGVGLRGGIGPSKFSYNVHAEFFYLPAVDGGFAVEQGGALRWAFTQKIALSAGYLLSVARFPYGTRLHALPRLDLVWAFE